MCPPPSMDLHPSQGTGACMRCIYWAVVPKNRSWRPALAPTALEEMAIEAVRSQSATTRMTRLRHGCGMAKRKRDAEEAGRQRLAGRRKQADDRSARHTWRTQKKENLLMTWSSISSEQNEQ
jgi:hypothetical protein